MSNSSENKVPNSPSKKLSSASKKFFILLNICFFLLIVGIGASVLFGFTYLKTPGPLTEDKVLVVETGTSARAIAEHLAENNIIKYPEIFIGLVMVSDYRKNMKAGEYFFPRGVTPLQVFRKISSGVVLIHRVTVAEGLMTSQILNGIKEDKYMTGDVPKNIGEGELLPETYAYYYGDSREKVINRMKTAMQQTIDELWEKRAENLPFKDKKEALTLASIVEKETRLTSERSRVAAVFINRLRKNMRLQTDPTVIYAITQGLYVRAEPLTGKDLAVESAYNTYKNFGLPPGPIANPGRASIEAVLHPSETGEYYFVADGTGGHKFASTLEEHNKNVKQWRELSK